MVCLKFKDDLETGFITRDEDDGLYTLHLTSPNNYCTGYHGIKYCPYCGRKL